MCVVALEDLTSVYVYKPPKNSYSIFAAFSSILLSFQLSTVDS